MFNTWQQIIRFMLLIVIGFAFLSTSQCYLPSSERQICEDGGDYDGEWGGDRRFNMLLMCAMDNTASGRKGDLCLLGMALFAECANRSTTRIPMIWHP